jgi:hypothetical protein
MTKTARKSTVTKRSNGFKIGKDNQGRFAKGNSFASGHSNPNARKTQLLQNALLDELDENSIKRIVKRLIQMAMAGNIQAAKEVLDRGLGKARQSVEILNDANQDAMARMTPAERVEALRRSIEIRDSDKTLLPK